MTTNAQVDWPREEDERWAAEVELRLVFDHDAPPGLADTLLAETCAVVREADSPARELFGAPRAYARTLASEHIDEERRALRDTGGLTQGERLAGSVLALGILGAALSVLRWVTDGLWVRPGWTAVVGVTTVVSAALLATLALIVWSAGRRTGAWAFAGGAVAAVAAGGGTLAAVPGTPLLTMPVPVLTALGLGVAVAAFRFPSRTADGWFTPPEFRESEGGGEGKEEDAEGLEAANARWARRLENVLRGRHALRAAEARGHAEEARQHLTASGERAVDAFGSPEVFALRLADGARTEERASRRKLYTSTLLGLGLVLLLGGELSEPDLSSPRFWLYVVAFALWIAGMGRVWQRTLTAERRRRRA